ncbi:hypothetical protein PN466_01860 [Roseofilum reptotaenium CS-1145]|uniref:Uncharacterized protein n=1 Tax=Roseofilum reptotaenium AO1-A TaxID=1925591 RepID=A0A1L9QMZ3_9CYAN|nr:hypothetical protein [Roseofilum reptotaenium]MDB9515706.1 hypothetical protein [Roseofilum reptotaenium CS-1145]OJJ24053.1 hypothetical protein BI308_18405 [Roseofilum reptotaenium AO1-A]
MAQVLVQVFIPVQGYDETQFYTYVDESNFPGMNLFNVGDKVRIKGELFTEEHLHTVESVNFDLPSRQWEYYIKFDSCF